jgi:hypothetical protein
MGNRQSATSDFESPVKDEEAIYRERQDVGKTRGVCYILDSSDSDSDDYDYTVAQIVHDKVSFSKLREKNVDIGPAVTLCSDQSDSQDAIVSEPDAWDEVADSTSAATFTPAKGKKRRRRRTRSELLSEDTLAIRLSWQVSADRSSSRSERLGATFYNVQGQRRSCRLRDSATGVARS